VNATRAVIALCAAAILFLAALPGQASDLAMEAWAGRAVWIADGDTLQALAPDGRRVMLRLFGVDCPERGQPYSRVAAKELSRLVLNREVEVRPMDRDRYGRVVALVRAGGVDVNEQMVALGLAWVYERHCVREFCDAWRGLQTSAREARLGLWRDADPTPPWVWRARTARAY